MLDHLQGNNEDKGMRVMCYVISAASIAICLFLVIHAILGW
jgi:hypothetical protein